MRALIAVASFLFATALAAQPKKDADLEQTVAALKRLGGSPVGFEVTPTAEIQLKEVDKATAAASKVPIFRPKATDDASLSRIPKSEAVVGLDLRGARFSDTGLKHISNLHSLHVLSLSRTNVSDDGWRNLAGCKELYVLDLSNTKLSSDALRQLPQFKELRTLDLSRTWVTDAGLQSLATFKQLRVLRVRGTQVTEAGAADLRKALPDVVVVR